MDTDDYSDGAFRFVCIEDIHGDLAREIFDIAKPLATPGKAGDEGVYGPVCIDNGTKSENGCYIVSVMSRYRREFFSPAWFEAETFFKENFGVPFTKMLDNLRQGDELLKQLSFQIWPNEHISEKKLKLRFLKMDMDRLLKPTEKDASTVPTTPPTDRGDVMKHVRLMERRAAVIQRVAPDVLNAHPEIYALSLRQIFDAGYAHPVPGEDEGNAAPEAAKSQTPPLVEAGGCADGAQCGPPNTLG